MMEITTARDWIASGRHLRTHSGHRIFYRDVGSGPAILMLHAFPTWSYDFAGTANELEADFRVITPDLLGYGASDKPREVPYSIQGAADMMEQLLASLDVSAIHLLGNGLGCLVAQEMMDRARRGRLSVELTSVMLMNCSIVFESLRPTLLHQLIVAPVLGHLIAAMVSKQAVFRSMNGAFGKRKMTPAAFDELWYGMCLQNGHRLARHQLKYNHERKIHTERWEQAVYSFTGPLAFIWGLVDPVSGTNALDAIKARMNNPLTIEFPNAGHYPQVEDPIGIANAIRDFTSGCLEGAPMDVPLLAGDLPGLKSRPC